MDDDSSFIDANSEALLADVDQELERVLSDRDQRNAVTLSDPQVNSLRRLALRIRNSKKTWRKVMTGDENKRVRDHAVDKVVHTQTAVKRSVRKVVTGSSDRPLREWVRDTHVVKTVDKFSFVLGVNVLMCTEFMCLMHPEQFGTFYVVLVSLLMALRFYMYAKSRYLYFLIDFCYFVNASCFVAILLFPNSNKRLWRLNFAASNGVLFGAILAWRNSLVFHSLDKVTSIAIHFLPGLLTYLERWRENSAMVDGVHDTHIGWKGAYLEPLLFYTGWQLLYIAKTEMWDRERLAADPSIQTSLRWLTRDSKNPMHILAKRVCRMIGVLQPTEEFEPEALKTKLVFWIGQLLFVLLTLLPIPLMFRYERANLAYILFVISAAIFNGSNYYFEVFAARYLQQLEVRSSPRSAAIHKKKD